MTFIGLSDYIVIGKWGISMKTEIVEISEINIVGIDVRTSNKVEATPEGRIISLHEQFLAKHLSEHIEQKKDQRIISLYTDYEDKESGEYTYAIGHIVKQIEPLPQDCQHYYIPAGRYLVYPTERGFLNEVLPQAWQNIWRLTQEQALGAERTFKVDFEFHNYEDSSSPDVQVDIFLSV